MLDNSKTLRFTKFLAKTNHSILRTSPKTLYKKSEEYNEPIPTKSLTYGREFKGAFAKGVSKKMLLCKKVHNIKA